MLRKFSFITFMLLLLLNCAQAASLREQTMNLLQDIEQTRLLLGTAMWQVHDLRNFALYLDESPDAVNSFDREHLRLYERIKPLDYAASSLLMALDLKDDRTAASDLAYIRGEFLPVAAEVLAQSGKVAAQHAKSKEALLTRIPMQVTLLAGMPWDDPVREWQRKAGVQIGWRTNMEPPADFRESNWNELQQLDIRYQLAKGKMLGITHLVFKDPVLRWDMLEPQQDKFDFSAFDRMMDLAKASQFKVKLIIPTMGGRVPDWWLEQRPQSVIRNEKGEYEYLINAGSYAHDFMGPVQRKGIWYQSRPADLTDEPTRERFANYLTILSDHCREKGYLSNILLVSADLFHSDRHWRIPVGAEKRAYVTGYFRIVGDMLNTIFAPIPTDLEVTDGEAHFTNNDLSANAWRSFGLAETVGMPAVDSETPFFEDLMRASALAAAEKRAGKPLTAGAFFYQNCEYGFGTMLSINYFTSLLRDGLWSDAWFGPEGPLRWGYFPQIFAYNDRQLQWSGITNQYLANRQAQLLGPTLANTRVEPAEVLLLLPSASMELVNTRVHRELIGWGWALTVLKVPYDVLSEAELSTGVPTRTKLLILPQAALLTDDQEQAVRKYVQGGGLLFSSMVPGTDGTAPSKLADVLGCDLQTANGKPVLVSQTGVKGTPLQVTIPRGLHSGKYAPVPPIDTGYPRILGTSPGDNAGRGIDQAYQALQLADGQQIAAYGTGQTAQVLHTFGKGKTLTSGYPYGQELFFADWTSMAFGKIYNGWARDEQMLGMIRWLRDALEQLGYQRITTVPEGWKYRLQGYEAAVSSLSYPKGPQIAADNAWAVSMTYLDSRLDHAIKQDHDDLDYAMELTWRDRPGVQTRYLCVGNRESAYAGERGSVQFWMMPHIVRIHISNPAITQIVDVAAGVPVKLTRDDNGISFRSSVPPALGRIFAVSTSDKVEIFPAGKFTGDDFDAIRARVVKFAKVTKQPETAVLYAKDIDKWLQEQGNKITIAYGNVDYQPAAAKLADWLQKRYGITAVLLNDDGSFKVERENVSITFQPAQAQILLGNSWSNNTIACIDSTWPYNSGPGQATASARLTATYSWPGGTRGVVTLTREMDLRREDGTTFGQSYGNNEGYAPRKVNDAKQVYLRQRLLLLASTSKGAMNAVKALTEAVIPTK